MRIVSFCIYSDAIRSRLNVDSTWAKLFIADSQSGSIQPINGIIAGYGVELKWR